MSMVYVALLGALFSVLASDWTALIPWLLVAGLQYDKVRAHPRTSRRSSFEAWCARANARRGIWHDGQIG